MGRETQARDLARSIDELQAEAARLSRKLTGSLAVQAVWPDAFKDGQKCTRCVHYLGPKVARRFLRRSDGAEFDLTPEQYETLRATD